MKPSKRKFWCILGFHVWAGYIRKAGASVERRRCIHCPKKQLWLSDSTKARRGHWVPE